MLHKGTKVLAPQYQHNIAAQSQMELPNKSQQIPEHQKFLLDYYLVVMVPVLVKVCHPQPQVATAQQTTLAVDHRQQQVAVLAPVALPSPARNHHCPL